MAGLAKQSALQRRYRSGGTSQAERLPDALRPELLQLDERGLPELLAHVAHFSENILFYDSTNLPEPRGPWALARHRSLLLLAVVAAQPIVGRAQTYTAALRPLLDAQATPAAQRLARQRLLQLLRRQALTLIGWAVAHQYSNRQRRFTDALGHILLEAAPALREAAACEQHLRAAGYMAGKQQLTAALLSELEALVPPQELADSTADLASPSGPGPADRTQYLIDLLWQLQRQQARLAEVASQSLDFDLQKNQDHRPEIGLLVAFLKLFRHAQDELNDIPRRHLAYYYEEVLRTSARPSTPDQTYLSFALAKGSGPYLLPAGTRVEGLDPTGQRVQFATAEDTVLAPWQVEVLATQYVARQAAGREGPGAVTGIYASAWADPAAGLGPGARALGAGWPLFGEDQSGLRADTRTMADAPVGWAVAAGVLSLPGGNRTITVLVQVSIENFASFAQSLKNIGTRMGRDGEMLLFSAFQVEITGPAGWHELAIQRVELLEAACTVRWILALDASQPAASGYDAAHHGGAFATAFPILRFVLNSHSPAYAYTYFAVLHPTTIRLQVEVDRVGTVALRNPLGTLDATTPFGPFGAQARPGDYLLLAAPELQGKNLQRVALAFTWQHLPARGFAAYYAGYEPPLANDSFRIGTAYRAGGSWQLAAEQRLFEADGPDGALRQTTTVQLDQVGYLDATANEQLQLKLTAPSVGFGADAYPLALVDAAYYNARHLDQPQALPLPPFILLAQELRVSYVAEEHLYPARGPIGNGGHFFHLPSLLNAYEPDAGQVALLPTLPDEGTLLVGLSPAAIGQLVTLAFELAPPLAGQSSTAEPLPAAQWTYLHQGEWVAIAPAAHLVNGLTGITSSCAVQVLLPTNLAVDSRQLPGGLCWLRATVAAGAAGFGLVRALHTQPVRAVRVAVDGTSPIAYQALMPAGSLTRLVVPQPQLASVGQPVPSFGGRPAEDAPAYYRRVSERLRHRNRALTPSDYEHLILELFPEVHSAKCLRPAQLPGQRVPGKVVLVVLPQADAVPNTAFPLFGTGQLVAMQQALQPLLSAAVQLEIRNPCYELLQVRCAVVLKPAASSIIRLDYLQQLQLGLAAMLSPWQQADAQHGGFHHHVSRSAVLAYVIAQPYVDTVTNLSLVKTAIIDGTHRFYDSAADPHDQGDLNPSLPWSVLVAAPQHMLTEYYSPAVAAAPAMAHIEEVPTGIGDLRIGVGFIIADSF